MENTKGTPVEILTTALAEMTQRAIEAERQRDIEKARGDEWYNYYEAKEAERVHLTMRLNEAEAIAEQFQKRYEEIHDELMKKSEELVEVKDKLEAKEETIAKFEAYIRENGKGAPTNE